MFTYKVAFYVNIIIASKSSSKYLFITPIEQENEELTRELINENDDKTEKQFISILLVFLK